MQRRLNRKIIGGFLGMVKLVSLVLVGYLLSQLIRQPELLAGMGKANEFSSVAYVTDGVLSREWLRKTLSLKKGTPLLAMDIFSIREQLEEDPQVARATVTREVPNRLKVSIHERVPCFRLVVADPGGERKVHLVAFDGTVYLGRDYEKARLRRLPFLTGVRLRRAEDRVLPIQGLGRVLDLVETARKDFPEVYADWRVVDLTRYDADPEVPFSTIRIRGERVEEALFLAENPTEQLKRLEGVVAYLWDRQALKVARVDLRFDGKVPVMPVQLAVGTESGPGYRN